MLGIRFSSDLVDKRHHCEHITDEGSTRIWGCEWTLSEATVGQRNHGAERGEYSDNMFIHLGYIPLIDILSHMSRYDRRIRSKPGR